MNFLIYCIIAVMEYTSGPLEAGFSSETDIDTVTNVMTSPQPSVFCHSAGDEREISSMTIQQPSSSQLYNM